MAVLSELEPKRVFHYFEELTKIPHGSGNTKAISDYCVQFAKERGFEHYQDAMNNVIIIKEAAEGYEEKEPVIIQGHLDMVCEKEAGIMIDFTKDALPLTIEDGYVTCNGTTLGGDDGIAIAYALALLDDDSFGHPRLEAVFTVDEEVGMLGAEAIDVSMLKGRRMLNIDSDEEGIFWASCAGGLTAECQIPVHYSAPEEPMMLYELEVNGLLGGHSGSEIHKERGNAALLLARVIQYIRKSFTPEHGLAAREFGLVSFEGGLKDNAIPREAKAVIALPEDDAEEVAGRVWEIGQILQKEYASSDAGVQVTFTDGKQQAVNILHPVSMENILFFLSQAPNGVQHMSMDIPGLVETSLNPGIVKLKKEAFSVTYSVRSSVASRKEELKERLISLTGFLGGKVQISGDYPAWEFQKESQLRNRLFSIYETLFGVKPDLQAVHAGLECGIFASKLKGLDCVSFGPTNYDIHTPKERLNIASVQKYWELLRAFLSQA